MRRADPTLQSGTGLHQLVEGVHQFYGQEVYAGLGSGIAGKKPIFRLVFAGVRLASKSRVLNAFMVATAVLGYRNIREPDNDVRIFQYGIAENNLAAFRRLNQCLDHSVQTEICISGHQVPLWGRVNVILALRRLWQAAGVLTARRHRLPLVHLQSVLAVSAALVFAARPLGDSIQTVCVASDHSPICMALLAAARRQRKATCYLQHAPVTEHFPPLTHDLSILYDRASVEAYRRAARKRDMVFDEAAIVLLPPFAEAFRVPQAGMYPYRLGICLSFLPNMTMLERLINSLSDRADVAIIYLRRHPRCRQDWSRIETVKKVELRPQGEAGAEFFATVDIVLVPNSGVAIDAMHYGRPTFFIPGADALPNDYYGFVADSILPLFSLEVLSAPTSFFDEAWQHRFAQYDETAAIPLTELRAEARRAFMALAWQGRPAEAQAAALLTKLN